MVKEKTSLYEVVCMSVKDELDVLKSQVCSNNDHPVYIVVVRRNVVSLHSLSLNRIVNLVRI